MDFSEKKKLKTSNTKQPQERIKHTRRIDFVTIILAFIALILLILVIFFMGREHRVDSPRVSDAQPPAIERVTSPLIRTEPIEPIEPMIKLGKPQLKKNSIEDSEETPDNTEPTGQAKARIFFIKFIDEKKIITKSVLRNVSASQSPMTVAITALLEGPKAGELSNNVFTLIPKESKLLRARVENGVAFLDFNEDFRFNTLGIDGYQAQVEQVVYTATEFSTIDKVQILIEGQRIDYLGGEGFWVGEPLMREDFE